MPDLVLPETDIARRIELEHIVDAIVANPEDIPDGDPRALRISALCESFDADTRMNIFAVLSFNQLAIINWATSARHQQ